jgi:predicted ATP-dependent endonuclease of OLD family
MKLRSVRIENFRSFRDETIQLDDYTCLVGPNNHGKSNVLMALNVFFRNTSATSADLLRLMVEDFHKKDVSKPIRITLTFTDLSEQAQKDFAAYYRGEKLIVSAVAEWNPDAGYADVRQFGSRQVLPAFRAYFEAEKSGAPANDLKAIFKELRSQYPELPAVVSKGDMAAALRAHEDSHPDLCEPASSEDQFYGWTKGRNLFTPHLQFIYVPAVKDASSEQEELKNTALSDLLSRAIRSRVDFSGDMEAVRQLARERYDKLVDDARGHLAELEASLQGKLQRWTTADSRLELKWSYDPLMFEKLSEPRAKAMAGDSAFVGEIVRLGHGMQRCFIIALLQELAESMEGGPKLLLCIEEPELYQHPPQARHFADVLEGLSKGNAQCLVTTHSPVFVASRGFEAVRRVHLDRDKSSVVRSFTYAGLATKLTEAKASHIVQPTVLEAKLAKTFSSAESELFFCRVPVLVESPEDIGFLGAQLSLMNLLEEFRAAGCHFIDCDGKTGIVHILPVAQALGLQPFVIWDLDSTKKASPDDNLSLFRLLGQAEREEPFSATIAEGPNFVAWADDIGSMVRAASAGEYDKAVQKVRKERGWPSGAVKTKEKMLTALAMEELSKAGVQVKPLEQACRRLIQFAQSVGRSGDEC